jgi:hypothetical protein
MSAEQKRLTGFAMKLKSNNKYAAGWSRAGDAQSLEKPGLEGEFYSGLHQPGGVRAVDLAE